MREPVHLHEPPQVRLFNAGTEDEVKLTTELLEHINVRGRAFRVGTETQARHA